VADYSSKLRALRANAGVLRQPHTRNPEVFANLAGPALRGLVLGRGRKAEHTRSPARHDAVFDWQYHREDPRIERLTHRARARQWHPDLDLDWSIEIDPHRTTVLPDEVLFLREIPSYRKLPARQQAEQRHAVAAWLLSQFLHGEQGALFAACQIAEAVGTTDAKLYAAVQVGDEGRHVDVFERYLDKLGQRFAVDDNLFVVLDALMRDGRWDLKFLGMQILVEGLALGAFGLMHESTPEPLLRRLLELVIQDEARHVHFGVVALEVAYARMPENERRMREDWAYEMCLLLRNRFLAHAYYEQYYAHAMSRRSWDRIVLDSDFLARFRVRTFQRILPNLRRIGLLSDRVQKHYAALGILQYASGKAAPELSEEELLSG